MAPPLYRMRSSSAYRFLFLASLFAFFFSFLPGTLVIVITPFPEWARAYLSVPPEAGQPQTICVLDCHACQRPGFAWAPSHLQPRVFLSNQPARFAPFPSHGQGCSPNGESQARPALLSAESQSRATVPGSNHSNSLTWPCSSPFGKTGARNHNSPAATHEALPRPVAHSILRVIKSGFFGSSWLRHFLCHFGL